MLSDPSAHTAWVEKDECGPRSKTLIVFWVWMSFQTSCAFHDNTSFVTAAKRRGIQALSIAFLQVEQTVLNTDVSRDKSARGLQIVLSLFKCS